MCNINILTKQIRKAFTNNKQRVISRSIFLKVCRAFLDVFLINFAVSSGRFAMLFGYWYLRLCTRDIFHHDILWKYLFSNILLILLKRNIPFECFISIICCPNRPSQKLWFGHFLFCIKMEILHQKWLFCAI